MTPYVKMVIGSWIFMIVATLLLLKEGRERDAEIEAYDKVATNEREFLELAHSLETNTKVKIALNEVGKVEVFHTACILLPLAHYGPAQFVDPDDNRGLTRKLMVNSSYERKWVPGSNPIIVRFETAKSALYLISMIGAENLKSMEVVND